MKRTVIVVALAWMAAAGALSAHERFRFIGTVVKMDGKAKLLTIKIEQKQKVYPPEVEVGITATTKVERDGRKLTSAALKPGLYVVVDALGDDALDTDALTIKIVPPPAKRGGKVGS